MPVFHCCVPKCFADSRKKSSSGLKKYPWMQDVTFFPLPNAKKQPGLRKKWLKRIRRDPKWTPTKYTRICSQHFVDRKPSEENPIPSIFGNMKPGTSILRPPNKLQRQKESQLAGEKRMSCKTATEDIGVGSDDPETVADIVVLPCDVDSTGVVEVVSFEEKASNISQGMEVYPIPSSDHTYCCHPLYVATDSVHEVACLTDVTGNIISTQEMLKSQNEIQKLRTQVQMLQREKHGLECEVSELKMKLEDKDKLRKELFLETVLSDDKSVFKYTGMPSLGILNGVFNILNARDNEIKYWRGKESSSRKSYQTKMGAKKTGPSRKLSKYDEYLLTLVRFRVGLLGFFVADIFGVSESRVSQIFATWINYMHLVLSPLLKWPSRQLVKKYMPTVFRKKYPTTRAIIDCSELFVQKPATPTAQACTWSNYKSHNTYKFLVAISPSGVFTFVSNLWGGNASDCHITDHSGFLDLIEEGDDIMADRGFTIRKQLTQRKATLNIPPFTHAAKTAKGKRLNSAQITKTKSIAKLRIHVERAIGKLKRFRLLNQVMPLMLKPLSNQMLKLAAIFCNFSPPIVKK
ncbi:uncharacterized protein [Ptychodera flava]|uniref:uncharacterized protein n=1 Tax=Ptychodera flava TaxID=63121 RepID=UPI00396A1C40